MAPLNTEAKTKIVQFYLETKSVVLTQRKFKRAFPHCFTPTRKTILRLTEHFLAFGTVQHKRKGNSGRKASIVTSENLAKINGVIQKQPKTSVRRLASLVGVSKSSVHRVLKTNLGLTPYKISSHQLLSKLDQEQRVKFCNWLKAKCCRSDHFLHNVWFSDEAHFHLCGQVNRQNLRFWGLTPPDEVLQTPLHSPKVTAWCAFSSQGIIGPFFF